MKRAIYTLLVFTFILLFTSCNTVEIRDVGNINEDINTEIVSEKEVGKTTELSANFDSTDSRTLNETPKESQSISLWLYVLLFVIAVLGIFVLVRIIQVKRKRELERRLENIIR